MQKCGGGSYVSIDVNRGLASLGHLYPGSLTKSFLCKPFLIFSVKSDVGALEDDIHGVHEVRFRFDRSCCLASPCCQFRVIRLICHKSIKIRSDRCISR